MRRSIAPSGPQPPAFAKLACAAIAAGADIALYCNGPLREMESIADALQPMSDESWERWEYAQNMVKPPEGPYSPVADSARLDMLLGAAAFQVKSIG